MTQIKKFQKKIFKWLKKKNIKLVRANNRKFTKKKFESSKICFYIKNKINYGCGLGHNPGYLFCLKHNFKYIARIDNDMTAPKNLMYNLIKRFESNKKIIALSPKVMFADKRNKIWFGGAKIGNNLKLQRQCSNYICGKKDSLEFRGLIGTDSVVGCASIMKSENLKQSGLSDPEFFYGEEDIELSRSDLLSSFDRRIISSSYHVAAAWRFARLRLRLLGKSGFLSNHQSAKLFC